MMQKQEIWLLLMQNEIDAIFSVDELLALRSIKTGKRLDIDVPMKLKIIGFGNRELSKEYYSSLSIVDLHGKKNWRNSGLKLIR